jgi:hypothetical protein
MLDRPKIYFLTENLRTGGIQRLLLDECYQLIEWGYQPKITSLTQPVKNDSIVELDEGFELLKLIDIEYLKPGKLRQINHFRRLIKKNSDLQVFVSHSVTGSVLARIGSVLAFRNIRIILNIHQLLTLSDRVQKLKRVIYSLSADRINFSSKQFQLDWEAELENRFILKRLLSNKFEFNRMGVYLPRLESLQYDKKNFCSAKVPHLIFLSRISSWKGFSKFNEVTKGLKSSELHAAAVTIFSDKKSYFDPSLFEDSYSHLAYNLSVAKLSLNPDSIHLYPSDYGSKVRFPQSIGMNVLEMVSQGIPSLISKENFESWPEFRNSQLIRIVDWTDLSGVHKDIKKILNESREAKLSETRKLRKVISIEKHCLDLLSQVRTIQ